MIMQQTFISIGGKKKNGRDPVEFLTKARAHKKWYVCFKPLNF